MTITNITDREIALQARVAELEAIEKQLSDNVVWQAGEIAKHLATIEASRKPEPVAWVTDTEFDSETEIRSNGWKQKYFAKIIATGFDTPLYANPVVAPDVLKDAERYRWLISDNSDADIQEPKQSRLVHAAWDKVLDCGGNYTKDEIDDAIDAAMRGAND